MSTKSLSDLLNLSTEPVTLVCPTHGEYSGQIQRFLSREMHSECPHCAAERAGAKRREAEARAVEEQRRARAQRYRAAGLPLRFWERDFEGYRARALDQRKALTTVQRYAEQFAKRGERGTCLLLCGQTGTGKTHLSVALAKVLMADGYDVRFVGARAMVREIRDAWRSPTERGGEHKGEGEVVSRLVQHDLLILDEVGMQFGSDAEKLLLFDVLNGRYEAIKPTVLISNLVAGELSDYLGTRIMDRMRENGGVMVPFTWSSERGAPVSPRSDEVES